MQGLSANLGHNCFSFWISHLICLCLSSPSVKGVQLYPDTQEHLLKIMSELEMDWHNLDIVLSPDSLGLTHQYPDLPNSMNTSLTS